MESTSSWSTGSSSCNEALKKTKQPLGYDFLTELGPLILSAGDLQSMLENHEWTRVTSEILVDRYLDQIEKHNQYGAGLHAVISMASRREVLDQARRLDAERRKGELRGPMHGIPIIVKVGSQDPILGEPFVDAALQDTLCTPSLNMETTCGSFALKGATAEKNAAVADLLIEAGMIIIAKTNLSVSTRLWY